MNNLINELTSASNEELRDILLTCDGRGKEIKARALELLLDRRFPSNVKDVPAEYYLDTESPSNYYLVGDTVRLKYFHKDNRITRIKWAGKDSCELEEARGGFLTWNYFDIEKA